MSLFLHETTEISTPRRPSTDGYAVASLIVAISGFVTIVGFFIGPVLAVIALTRIGIARTRGERRGGRRIAIVAIAISLLTIVLALLVLLAILITAYAALPTPKFF